VLNTELHDGMGGLQCTANDSMQCPCTGSINRPS